ncbi:hypothetical protein [Acidianus manzaensis]|uniref:Uncharacterized protein n=1 Tax=Acidianus manzaensis TaxID=282676 RepID=A0A1W6JYE4_9CREN|nr:hypothetical protein [Acidianus manzaensis]ARM75265.1 hypothetical protein B6F84_03950 [Acidianus manzaensis]
MTLPLVPLAVGFFGLGTGYFVYGGWEVSNYPNNSEALNKSLGQWGIWMPGFMQFITGILLWMYIAFYHITEANSIYMAALAFTAYGVHWFAMGLNKHYGGDTRVDGYMAVAFLWISIIGALIFYKTSNTPVGILFTLLALVYVSDIPASLLASKRWTRVKGAFHLITGVWLMYLTFAAATTFALGWSLPL